MSIDFKLIKEGWLNQLNYHALSEDKKAVIQARGKICMGDPETGTPRCENFVYSPIYKYVEKVVKVPHMIKTWLQEKREFVYMKDTKNRMRSKTVRESTGEVLGAVGYKCKDCGCDFAAGVSSPDYHCPLKLWPGDK